MIIDVDRCNGCGSCMVACAVENNVPPAAANATDRTGLTWIRVFSVDNGAEGADRRSAFIPVLCQHCGKDAPCVSVCPQQAVEVDPATGIVGQMPRALPRLPLLHGRLPLPRALLQLVGSGVARRHGKDSQSRRRSAYARRSGEVQLLPRPLARRQDESGGRRQGRNRSRRLRTRLRRSLPQRRDHASAISTIRQRNRARRTQPNSFRLLESLDTDPKIHYQSKKAWVREIANAPAPGKENARG